MSETEEKQVSKTGRHPINSFIKGARLPFLFAIIAAIIGALWGNFSPNRETMATLFLGAKVGLFVSLFAGLSIEKSILTGEGPGIDRFMKALGFFIAALLIVGFILLIA